MNPFLGKGLQGAGTLRTEEMCRVNVPSWLRECNLFCARSVVMMMSFVVEEKMRVSRSAIPRAREFHRKTLKDEPLYLLNKNIFNSE